MCLFIVSTVHLPVVPSTSQTHVMQMIVGHFSLLLPLYLFTFYTSMVFSSLKRDRTLLAQSQCGEMMFKESWLDLASAFLEPTPSQHHLLSWPSFEPGELYSGWFWTFWQIDFFCPLSSFKRLRRAPVKWYSSVGDCYVQVLRLENTQWILDLFILIRNLKICMVFHCMRLRRVLERKAKKSSSLNNGSVLKWETVALGSFELLSPILIRRYWLTTKRYVSPFSKRPSEIATIRVTTRGIYLGYALKSIRQSSKIFDEGQRLCSTCQRAWRWNRQLS